MREAAGENSPPFGLALRIRCTASADLLKIRTRLSGALAARRLNDLIAVCPRCWRCWDRPYPGWTWAAP
eukprot:CAMPEP_0171219938 /NCGR_PEP_ID=MMETSP0790-20130122/33976_1 /TAXON_ID=2925 /ORGANISM="Alexandrium catenella, Strain OF101" /LENGTH=68 /DNA_ID=CAMNT_0011685809 /DNA_START=74 /DNA_END=277 /DNA_ORIENTATION=+